MIRSEREKLLRELEFLGVEFERKEEGIIVNFAFIRDEVLTQFIGLIMLNEKLEQS